MKSRLPHFLLIVVALGLFASSAQANVNLLFSPSTGNIAPGSGQFTVTLQLQVTAAEQVTGIDFILRDLNYSGTVHFFIMSRTKNNSVFDTYVTASDATVTTRPAADLNPNNDNDLGAFTSDQSSRSPAAATTVMTFTLGYQNAVAGASYTISTGGNPAGAGASFWSDSAANNFAQHNVNSEATFTFSVIPEPATWSFIGLGGLLAVGLNRFRARRKA